ncbi:hypothetical protein VTN77DRAFT_3445 [Rasamsonia byssochlamydoides]|uniref:uncharacterized protein n=1 Tax=Rasamsonia byssochlamydoides TaxID=89139 RepID=UPI0037446BBD
MFCIRLDAYVYVTAYLYLPVPTCAYLRASDMFIPIGPPPLTTWQLGQPRLPASPHPHSANRDAIHGIGKLTPRQTRQRVKKYAVIRLPISLPKEGSCMPELVGHGYESRLMVPPPVSQPTGMQLYRAPSLFQPHRARQALRDAHEGKIPPLYGFYLGLSSVELSRLVAPLGFDVVWIDWEHTSCNVEAMTTMVHNISFMSEGRTIPFVRVPGHEHSAIGYALDAGASIIIPQVNTVEEARFVISAAKFGRQARGNRSAPPYRLLEGITDARLNPDRTAHQNWNDQAAIIIQIESLEGIDNLDAILTEVPEIDAVWLGTLDLQVSMDLTVKILAPQTDPEFVAAKDKYERICRKHNKPIGGFVGGSPELMKISGEGKAFLVVGCDVLGILTQLDHLARAKEVFQKKQTN